jgi:hypothetical protein
VLFEIEAGEERVRRIARAVHRCWPEIVALIGPLLGETVCLDDPEASVEFGVAALAVHIQASAEDLAPEEAARVRSRIVNRLCRTLGAVWRPAVEQYERVWRDAVTAGRAPLDGVTRLLCERWARAHSDSRLRTLRMDPLAVVMLGSALLTWAAPWSKPASGTVQFASGLRAATR